MNCFFLCSLGVSITIAYRGVDATLSGSGSSIGDAKFTSNAGVTATLGVTIDDWRASTTNNVVITPPVTTVDVSLAANQFTLSASLTLKVDVSLTLGFWLLSESFSTQLALSPQVSYEFSPSTFTVSVLPFFGARVLHSVNNNFQTERSSISLGAGDSIRTSIHYNEFVPHSITDVFLQLISTLVILTIFLHDNLLRLVRELVCMTLSGAFLGMHSSRYHPYVEVLERPGLWLSVVVTRLTIFNMPEHHSNSIFIPMTTPYSNIAIAMRHFMPTQLYN